MAPSMTSSYFRTTTPNSISMNHSYGHCATVGRASVRTASSGSRPQALSFTSGYSPRCPRASTNLTGSWTTGTPTARSRRCVETGSGCTPTPWSRQDGPSPGSSGSERVQVFDRRRFWRMRGSGPLSVWTWGSRRCSGCPRCSWARTFAGVAVDMGNPHLACVVPGLDEDALARIPVDERPVFDSSSSPTGSMSRSRPCLRRPCVDAGP